MSRKSRINQHYLEITNGYKTLLRRRIQVERKALQGLWNQRLKVRNNMCLATRYIESFIFFDVYFFLDIYKYNFL